MLIKFESKDGANFVMLQDTATALLRMMGTNGATEGAVSEEQLSIAIEKLQSALALEQKKPEQQPAEDENDDDEEEEEAPVAISARAQPLLEMLQQAKVQNSFVMWRPE
ncbi:MAG: DUF1840 domain-containing protein [Pseudohongiellaceae bacterium]|nr:DUF1840 domain-containing protein [Pseudohongiellaceae bacterium]